MIEKISNEVLEEYAKKVAEDLKYGKEFTIISDALNNNPYNKDISSVAMKVSLIDLVNGTSLRKSLGREGGLYKLCKKITEVNFDKRVKMGDLTLVNELAEWTRKELNRNLFSFISKYCLYHNFCCYNSDSFVIYDSVVSSNLDKYISSSEYEDLTGEKLQKNSFDKLRTSFNYEEFKKVIDYIIEKNGITVDKPRRKLDWFIWYKHRR